MDKQNSDPASSASTSTQAFNLPYVVLAGASFVVLFFILFMFCARQWDKWVTKKFFSTRIFIPQHINSFGSSHMSAIVDDNEWNMSEESGSANGDIGVNSESSGDNPWVDAMFQELSNFHSILERGRKASSEQRPPIHFPIGAREDGRSSSICDEQIGEEISSSIDDDMPHEPIRVNTNSLDSDWSSITGSSSNGIVSSSSEDYDSYLTSYYTCSSDSDTVKIKNSRSDPSEEEGELESSTEETDGLQHVGRDFGYYQSSEREV